jgi:hypothetical protein
MRLKKPAYLGNQFILSINLVLSDFQGEFSFRSQRTKNKSQAYNIEIQFQPI